MERICLRISSRTAEEIIRNNIKTELEGAYYNQAKKIYNKVIEMYNESQGKIKIPLLAI